MNAEPIIDPRAIDAINHGYVEKDWRTIARRLTELEGGWQLLGYAQNQPDARGIVRDAREQLRGKGVRCEVHALYGLGEAGTPRPWSGWAIFARVPR